MSTSKRWIVIPNWRDYQHYPDRDPIWIKDYTRQLVDDDYLALTASQRGLLQGLRLLYAESDGRVRLNTAQISRKLCLRVTNTTLKALSDAGWVRFSASKPLALRYQIARADQKVLEEVIQPTVDKGSSSGDLNPDKEIAVLRLLTGLRGSDATKASLRHWVDEAGIAPSQIHQAREEFERERQKGATIKSDVAYVKGIFRRYISEREAA